MLFFILAAYFLANFTVRMALPHGLELDEAEQTYLAQWLLAGYGPQPPFYDWVQNAVFHAFGVRLEALAGLKNVMLFLSYGAIWLAARQVLKTGALATVATLGLLTMPQISFEAQRDLSHTVAAVFGVAIFMFALLRVLTRPSLDAFILLGIATGIGGITKYNFVLLPAAAFLAMLADPDLRRRLLDWRLIPAAIIAFVIVSPHAYWLIDNARAASDHTMDKMTGLETNRFLGILNGLWTLLTSALGMVALTAVVFAGCFYENVRRIATAESQWTRLIGRIILIALAIIVLMVLFAGIDRVRDRWLTPVLMLVPLYLALKVDAAGVDTIRAGLRRFWVVAVIIMIAVPTALFARAYTAKYTGEYGYVSIPFDRLSKDLTEPLFGPPTIVVAGDGQLAGNIRFNQPTAHVITTQPITGQAPTDLSPYRRIIFVWRSGDGTVPGDIGKAFGAFASANGLDLSQAHVSILDYPYSWGKPGDQYQFGAAVLDR